jgi:hypothetical protein
MAVFTTDDERLREPVSAGKMINAAGAVVSLALIAGIGVWGYKLIMRDVTGIPVVKALEGPMRVMPDNPGGEIAPNAGLSVNAVAAEGEAAPPEDLLVLAPRVVQLTDEDLAVQPTAEAGEVVAMEAAQGGANVGLAEASELLATQADETLAAPMIEAVPDEPLTAEQILALADQIAANLTPLEPLADGETAPIEMSINDVPLDVIADIVPASEPGVAVSLRPMARPETLVTSTEAAAADGNATTVPIGTPLVQLGAFDSAEIAQSEWARLTGRFADFMAGKTMVVQEASLGGRTFYRLRAMGFADLSDARRLCTALLAEGADCVPLLNK